MKSVATVTHLHIHSDWKGRLSKKSVSWSRYLEQIQPCLVSLVYFLIYDHQSTTGLYPLQRKNCCGWLVHNTFQTLSSQTSKIFWDTAALRAHHRKSVQLTYFNGGVGVFNISASIEATMPIAGLLRVKNAWSEENNKGVEVTEIKYLCQIKCWGFTEKNV